MQNQYFFISEDPRTAVTMSGQMSESFQKNQLLRVVQAGTRKWYTKIVERVVNCGNGNCVVEFVMFSR